MPGPTVDEEHNGSPWHLEPQCRNPRFPNQPSADLETSPICRETSKMTKLSVARYLGQSDHHGSTRWCSGIFDLPFRSLFDLPVGLRCYSSSFACGLSVSWACYICSLLLLAAGSRFAASSGAQTRLDTALLGNRLP
jgi:hypothetical protein